MKAGAQLLCSVSKSPAMSFFGMSCQAAKRKLHTKCVCRKKYMEKRSALWWRGGDTAERGAKDKADRGPEETKED